MQILVINHSITVTTVMNNLHVALLFLSLTDEEPRSKPRPLPGYHLRQTHRSSSPPLREELPQLIPGEDTCEVCTSNHLPSCTCSLYPRSPNYGVYPMHNSHEWIRKREGEYPICSTSLCKVLILKYWKMQRLVWPVVNGSQTSTSYRTTYQFCLLGPTHGSVG